jgi:hypothetical protein
MNPRLYMLTKESLQQICGTNTLFSHVSCGYGLFPPVGVGALSPEVTNWGKANYDDYKSTTRKFLKKKKIIVCRKLPLRNYIISEETTPNSFWQSAKYLSV